MDKCASQQTSRWPDSNAMQLRNLVSGFVSSSISCRRPILIANPLLQQTSKLQRPQHVKQILRYRSFVFMERPAEPGSTGGHSRPWDKSSNDARNQGSSSGRNNARSRNFSSDARNPAGGIGRNLPSDARKPSNIDEPRDRKVPAGRKPSGANTGRQERDSWPARDAGLESGGRSRDQVRQERDLRQSRDTRHPDSSVGSRDTPRSQSEFQGRGLSAKSGSQGSDYPFRGTQSRENQGTSGGRDPAGTRDTPYAIDYSQVTSEVPVEISPKPEGISPIHKFNELNISRILKENIERRGFTSPTPVQKHCLPILLQRHDIMTCSQTGSGKTLMYIVPALEALLSNRLNSNQQVPTARSPSIPLVLVLAPTRELAIQIQEESKSLTGTRIPTACCYGGASVREQRSVLRQNPPVVIATPGRLQQFMEDGTVNLQGVQYLVVDEADRMLDMGFEPALRYIDKNLNKSFRRQNIMCSATFPKDIQRLASEFLRENYFFVAVGRVGSVANTIVQDFVWAEDQDKPRALLKLLSSSEHNNDRTMVFINRKDDIEEVERLISKQFRVGSVHGDKTQDAREKTLNDFRAGRLPILVATDVAARGLDIQGVTHVIQYDPAKDIDGYTHRIGRTGRAGNKGHATTFINGSSRGLAEGLVRNLEEINQYVPLFLRGLANLSLKLRMDEIDESVMDSEDDGDDDDDNSGYDEDDGERADNKSIGSQDESDVGVLYGGQDFRRNAQVGTYGKEKDNRFLEFEEKAYEAEEFTEKKLNELEKKRELKAIARENRRKQQAAVREKHIREFERPPISPELEEKLYSMNCNPRHLGRAPDLNIQRQLQNDRDSRLYFEYLGMFSPQTLVTKSKFREYLDTLPKVLVVAEKPSVAERLAMVLSNNSARKRRGVSRGCPVFEFAQHFGPAGEKCTFRVTSTIGHVLSLTFYDQKNIRDPEQFFEARIVKSVEGTSEKLKVPEHLKQEADGCQHLVLCLDDDREGENIAFEVISLTRDSFPDDRNIHRARFSALNERDLRYAFTNLDKPRVSDSQAVDLRQELDLKVGVALSRLFTQKCVGYARRMENVRLISYGPCQSPTLYFVVLRYIEIMKFQSERYWTIKATGKKFGKAMAAYASSNPMLHLTWKEAPCFDEPSTRDAQRILEKYGKNGKVISVDEVTSKISAPNALNTVNMLVALGKSMGMSPNKILSSAESLYTSGLISYPRTETSQYPKNYDITAVLDELAGHPRFGNTAKYILRNFKRPTGGKSVGDHEPICPTRCVTEAKNPMEYRIYEYVVQHFLASLMEDIKYRTVTAEIEFGSGMSDDDKVVLVHQQNVIDSVGFGPAMPWKLREIEGLGSSSEQQALLSSPRRETSSGYNKPEPVSFKVNDPVSLHDFKVVDDWTNPPEFLKEHELVHLMDENGIGTDASMAGHIATIIERKYAVIVDQEFKEIVHRPPGSNRPKQIGRYLVPTPLGISFMEALMKFKLNLVHPSIRALMEAEVAQVANGTLSKDVTLAKNLSWFRKEFVELRQEFSSIEEMFQNRDYIYPIRQHLSMLRKRLLGVDSPSAPSGGNKTRSNPPPSARRGGNSRNGNGNSSGKGSSNRGSSQPRSSRSASHPPSRYHQPSR